MWGHRQRPNCSSRREGRSPTVAAHRAVSPVLTYFPPWSNSWQSPSVHRRSAVKPNTLRYFLPNHWLHGLKKNTTFLEMFALLCDVTRWWNNCCLNNESISPFLCPGLSFSLRVSKRFLCSRLKWKLLMTWAICNIYDHFGHIPPTVTKNTPHATNWQHGIPQKRSSPGPESL